MYNLHIDILCAIFWHVSDIRRLAKVNHLYAEICSKLPDAIYWNGGQNPKDMIPKMEPAVKHTFKDYVIAGNIHMVQHIIEKGLAYEIFPESTMTWIGRLGRLEILRYLLKVNAEKYIPYLDEALNAAAYHGQLSILDYLMKTYKDSPMTKLLYCAISGNKVESVHYLMKDGGKVYLNDSLHFAAILDHVDVVKYLVENGANTSGLIVDRESKVEKYLTSL